MTQNSLLKIYLPHCPNHVSWKQYHGIYSWFMHTILNHLVFSTFGQFAVDSLFMKLENYVDRNKTFKWSFLLLTLC